MDEQKDFRKIIVRLILPKELFKERESYEYLESQKGFNEKCKEKEHSFSSLISNEIDNKVGKDNWALVFDETTYDRESFDVGIYCPDDSFDLVRVIIRNGIKGIIFKPEYKGIIKDYISTLH